MELEKQDMILKGKGSRDKLKLDWWLDGSLSEFREQSKSFAFFAWSAAEAMHSATCLNLACINPFRLTEGAARMGSRWKVNAMLGYE